MFLALNPLYKGDGFKSNQCAEIQSEALNQEEEAVCRSRRITGILSAVLNGGNMTHPHRDLDALHLHEQINI